MNCSYLGCEGKQLNSAAKIETVCTSDLASPTTGLTLQNFNQNSTNVVQPLVQK